MPKSFVIEKALVFTCEAELRSNLNDLGFLSNPRKTLTNNRSLIWLAGDSVATSRFVIVSRHPSMLGGAAIDVIALWVM
jgi:hypothetical protein